VLVRGGASAEAVEAYLPSIASQLFRRPTRSRAAVSQGSALLRTQPLRHSRPVVRGSSP